MNLNPVLCAALLSEWSIFDKDLLRNLIQMTHWKINFPMGIESLQKALKDLGILRDLDQEIYRKLIAGIEMDLHKNRRLLVLGDPEYPESFEYLDEPPLLLRLEGSCAWKLRKGLSIVGSREPREHSVRWMNSEIKGFLQKENCFIASGGARGVDQRAHLIALQMGAPTIIFLPSGLDCKYPSNLASFQEMVLDFGGAFVSEYASDKPMRKHYFIQRNRLISGISLATLIVEAKIKSGTMLTARECIEQHLPLWVVPGHPMDSGMTGNNQLLLDGATPVLAAQDLIELFSAECMHLNREKESRLGI